MAQQLPWDFSKVTLVITHAFCRDGQACAAIIHNYMEYMGVDPNQVRFHYVPAATTEQHVPALDYHDYVLICDVGFQPEVLLSIQEQVSSLHVIDHHDTWLRRWELEQTFQYVSINFHDQYCAAWILWQQLYGPYYQVPLFIQYIDDQDLMKRQLPDCDLFRAATHSLSWNFKSMVPLIWMDNEKLNNFIESGQQTFQEIQDYALMAYREGERYHWTIEETGQVLKCISVEANKFKNEVALFVLDRCDKSYDIVLVHSYSNQDHTTHFTVASRENGPHVGEIAERYDGGGHVHVAGIKLKGKWSKLPVVFAPYNVHTNNQHYNSYHSYYHPAYPTPNRHHHHHYTTNSNSNNHFPSQTNPHQASSSSLSIPSSSSPTTQPSQQQPHNRVLKQGVHVPKKSRRFKSIKLYSKFHKLAPPQQEIATTTTTTTTTVTTMVPKKKTWAAHVKSSNCALTK